MDAASGSSARRPGPSPRRKVEGRPAPVCGIAGLFDPERAHPSEWLGAQVARMTATLTHRGPDAEGHWSDPEHGIFFGHRRLSVVELGPEGSQPMHSGDGRWVVTYNGEIYNHAGAPPATGRGRRRLPGRV